MAENDIGKVIKQQRAMRLMTLKDLAIAVGVSQSYLSRIEKGERHPSGKILRKIAPALHYSTRVTTGVSSPCGALTVIGGSAPCLP